MVFHVITLFPELIESGLGLGLVGQAFKNGRLELKTINPRTFTSDVHHTVDDRPFGGGDGMVMLAEPLARALESITLPQVEPRHVIHFSPRGKPLTDKRARELAKMNNLILVSSRYGGVDQRFLNAAVSEEISVGDYVLSGGELPALILIDAVARHIRGVLGNEESPENESFSDGLLEAPQFTRPRDWRSAGPPAVYLSGHHSRISQEKRLFSILVTAERRPDLLRAACKQMNADGSLEPHELKLALNALELLSEADFKALGLLDRGLITYQLRQLCGG